MNFDKIDEAVGSCHTLLDALFAVSSLGAFSGTIELTAGNIHGWIAFHQKKVTKAIIAETGQTGETALQLLATLDNAQCRYLPPWVKPVIEPTTPTQPLSVNDQEVVSPSAQPLATDSSPEDATTQVFGEGMMTLSQETAASNVAPIWRKPMEEKEFRDGIFESDQHSEFMQQEGKLGNLDAPVRKNTHYTRNQMETAGTSTTDAVAAVIARAGFISDFRDATPEADPWGAFHGDPANQPTASVAIKKSELNFRPYVGPTIVACLCVAAYVGPQLIWHSAGNTGSDPIEKQQVKRIVYTAYDQGQDDKPRQRQAFVLPPGASTAPAQPASPPDTTGGGSSDAPAAEPKYTAGDEASELRLAQSPASLSTLEALIRSYISAKQYRRARSLAAAGFRSGFCTPAERQRFWQLYVECRNK